MLGDTRWNNSISYTNNARDPLRVVFAANADETTPGGSNGHNVGLQRRPTSPGRSRSTVVGERIRNSAQPLPPGFERQIVLQAGATYDFQFVRVYGQVGRIKTEATDDARTDVVPARRGGADRHRPDPRRLRPRSTRRRRRTATTDRTASIGYDYFLSKSTDIYVAALHEKLSFVSSGNSIAGGVRVALLARAPSVEDHLGAHRAGALGARR